MSKKKRPKEKQPAPKAPFGRCESCDQFGPIVKETGMCGPCTFGEADALHPLDN